MKTLPVNQYIYGPILHPAQQLPIQTPIYKDKRYRESEVKILVRTTVD